MNPYDTKTAVQMAGLYREHEKKTNRIIGVVLYAVGGLYMVMPFVPYIGVMAVGTPLSAWFMLAAGIADAVLGLFIRRSPDWRPAHRLAIVHAITLTAAVTFFFYPSGVSFVVYGPILVSALYYNTAFVKKTALFTWVVFSLLLWANVVLADISPYISRYQLLMDSLIWHYPKDVLLYRFIPGSIFFGVTAYICYTMARRGRELVARQAEITGRMVSMDAELQLAAEIQRASLPEPERTVDGLRVDAVMRPARVVGGDFYDYYRADGDIVFLIADVSDKGLSAAMFMMEARDELKMAVYAEESLTEAVTSVNRVLCADNRENMFLTLWIARINPNTGFGQYVNCGHPAPLLRRTDGTVRKLENEPEPLLGVFEDAVFTAHPLRLNKGETLLLYTDGLTDAADRAGVRFGEERLSAAVSAVPADEERFCEKLVQRISEYAEGADRTDDITALALTLRTDGVFTEERIESQAGDAYTEKVLDCLNALLEKAGCPENARRGIGVAADEICSNIADYAYPGGQGVYSVRVRTGENFAELTFTDSGVPFDPLAEAPAAPADGLPEGGLGILLVRSVMDDVSYERADGENRLTLLKIW